MKHVSIAKAHSLDESDLGRAIICAGFDGSIEKLSKVNIEERTARFCISVAEDDRYGDVVVQDGIDTKAWQKNPVVLLNHRHDTPIGKGFDIQTQGKKTFSSVKFATTEKAEETYQLVKQDVLRATSIGFIPKKWERREDPDGRWIGYKFLESELTEWSVVAVPAVRNALITSKSILADVSMPDGLDLFGRDANIRPAIIKTLSGKQVAYDHDGVLIGEFVGDALRITKHYQNILGTRNLELIDGQQVKPPQPAAPATKRARDMARNHLDLIKLRAGL